MSIQWSPPMSLAGLFVVGFVTWGLVVLRGFALASRRPIVLGCLIFADECCAVGCGVWLARYGGALDILALAAGGALSGSLVVWWSKRR